MNSKLLNAGLVTLTAIAVGLSALSVTRFRLPDSGEPIQAVPSAVATPSAVSSSVAPTTPTLGPSTPLLTPTVSPRPRTLQGVQDLFKQESEVTVVVLGDATGEAPEGWVAAWAKQLSASRTVELTSGAGASTTQGSGRQRIRIRNYSSAEMTLQNATQALAGRVDAEADLVVLSFGHGEKDPGFTERLQTLVRSVPASAEVLVIAQNPEKGANAAAHNARMQNVAKWASGQGLPLVNVYEAFIKAPEPLADLLDKQGAAPNLAGADLWGKEIGRVVSP